MPMLSSFDTVHGFGFVGHQVRAEVVEHDRDPHLGRIGRPQVAAEPEKLGASLSSS